MKSKIVYSEIYDFNRLERAARRLHLRETEETETGLYNLHNHLVWHSYIPGKDPVADAVLSSVITELLEEHNLTEIPDQFRYLVEGAEKEVDWIGGYDSPERA